MSCDREIGSTALVPGSITPVKVLGVLAMIDDGELDWKVRCPPPVVALPCPAAHPCPEEPIGRYAKKREDDPAHTVVAARRVRAPWSRA